MTEYCEQSSIVCVYISHLYIPHFPDPVISRWAFELVPGLSYCELSCYKYRSRDNSCADVIFLDKISGMGWLGCMVGLFSDI